MVDAYVTLLAWQEAEIELKEAQKNEFALRKKVIEAFFPESIQNNVKQIDVGNGHMLVGCFIEGEEPRIAIQKPKRKENEMPCV